MADWAVALHVFVTSVGSPDDHGYTDSARSTVEAINEYDAIVRATAEYVRDLAPDKRIGNSMPSVKRLVSCRHCEAHDAFPLSPGEFGPGE